MTLTLASEWLTHEGNTPFDKQDCERKAFPRLAEKIHTHFPRTPLCLLLDGLYANLNTIRLIESKRWKYITCIAPGAHTWYCLSQRTGRRMNTHAQHSLKHRLEYGLFWLSGAVFARLPYRAALLLGWGLAGIGHYLFRYRVDLAHARIREVFPTASPAQVRRIAWLSWRHLVFNLVDICRMKRMDQAWLRRHMVDYESAAARIREYLAYLGSGGAVGLSIHMGCVEMIARAIQQLGVDVFVIVKTQKNLLVDRQLNAMRGSTGITCIPQGAGLYKQVFRRLRRGGVLSVLNDIRAASGGIAVDFLGRQVSVSPGGLVFAKKTGVPVLAAFVVREGWTRHRLHLFPPICPDDRLPLDEDVKRMTQSAFDIFDQAVRAYPEQWFWYNKNWILAPARQNPASAATLPDGGAV